MTTSIDPNNLVVKLCTEGMQAEGEDRLADAILTSLGQSPGNLDFTVFLSKKQT